MVVPFPVLGLTGLLASGKSTLAAQLQQRGAAVWSADNAVHQLQQADTAQSKTITETFGAAVLTPQGAVDRAALGTYIAQQPDALAQLEAILFPAVVDDARKWLAALAPTTALAVLDAPLLFQAGLEQLCTQVAVCQCDEDTRHQRALQRPDMTAAKLAAFDAHQLPQDELARRADILISTNTTAELETAVSTLLQNLPETSI